MGKPKECSWSWGRSSMRSVPLSSSSSSRGEHGSGQTMGCMAHVLHHLFDFHMKAEEQHPQGLLPDQTDGSHDLFRKGVEAPRNSLEQEEGLFMAGPSSSSSSSAIKDEEDLYIPFSIQIPPFRSRNAAFTSKPKSPSPSSPLPRSSPLQQSSPKTPNVVARLMGLDILPPNAYISSAISSPSFRRPSSSGRRSKGVMSSTSRHESGTRSLPDTPRMSLARRSDVEHRLSLQLNKENMTGTPPELDFGMGSRDSSPVELSVRRTARKKESSRLKPVAGHDENRGTVKKAGRRMFGDEITNASLIGRCRGSSDGNQDYTSPPDTSLKKARRNAREREETSPQVQTCKHVPISTLPSPPNASSFPSSPRSRAQVDQVGKNVRVLTTMGSGAGEDRGSKPLTSPPSKSHKQHKSSLPKLAVKCRKGSCEKYTTSKPPARRSSLQPLHHEIVVSKHEKKLRKEEKRVVPSEEEDPPGLLPDSSEPSTRHTYGSSPTRLGHRGNTTRTRTGTGTSNQLHYLRTLLGLAGFSAHLPVSAAFASVRSLVHPLDPSLFFRSFEQDRKQHGHDDSFCELRARPNRRLLFCLTNEILGQLLRPHLRLRPWLPSSRRPLAMPLPAPTGVELLDRIWTRILAFPGADCQTLQDIDQLVGSDIPDVGLDRDGVEEEWEEIAVDIGRRILDFLVEETASGLRMSGPAAAKFDPVDLTDMVTWDFT